MTDTLLVRGARVVTPDQILETTDVLAIGGRIAAIGTALNTPTEAVTLDGTGMTLLPGFLDLHIHGAGGADTMDARAESLRTICRIHAQHGTTGLLATTMTQSRDAISEALDQARQATEAGISFTQDGAQVLGIHLEGPYLHPEKPGAQPRAFVRDYAPEEFAHWRQITRGSLRRITIAPERPGGAELLATCKAAGIALSFGHTNASAAEIRSAIDAAGIADATHLFNAMNGIHHRMPGPVPVFLTDPRTRVEIIADGHHVAPDVVRLAVAAAGVERVICITDAMAGAGAPEGLYDLGGNPVTVREGKATLADGTLAGSLLTMDRAAANLQSWCNLNWRQVARVTSTNAAERMGWLSKGRIAVDADADLVLLNDAFEVHATIVSGQCRYRR